MIREQRLRQQLRLLLFFSIILSISCISIGSLFFLSINRNLALTSLKLDHFRPYSFANFPLFSLEILLIGGFIILLGAQYLRVILMSYYYFKTKDYFFGCIALLVLLGLIASFFLPSYFSS